MSCSMCGTSLQPCPNCLRLTDDLLLALEHDHRKAGENEQNADAANELLRYRASKRDLQNLLALMDSREMRFDVSKLATNPPQNSALRYARVLLADIVARMP